MMRVSSMKPMFTPASVRKSLIASGWTLHDTHRSISTGGNYEVWVHGEDKWTMGYASVPMTDEYIPRFAEEVLSNVAKHYNLSQEQVYVKLMKGEQI